MSKKYRVAVIGATGRGNYGHGLDEAFQGVEGTELVAVADADAKGLAAASAKSAARPRRPRVGKVLPRRLARPTAKRAASLAQKLARLGQQGPRPRPRFRH